MNAGSPVSSAPLFQVNMPVTDIRAGVGFYRDRLGLTLHTQRDGLAFFSIGSVRLLVEQVNEEGGRYGHPGSILYFQVPDVDRAYQDLQRRGVRFVDPPSVVGTQGETETWMAFFDDGQWNTHAIVSTRKRTP